MNAAPDAGFADACFIAEQEFKNGTEKATNRLFCSKRDGGNLDNLLGFLMPVHNVVVALIHLF